MHIACVVCYGTFTCLAISCMHLFLAMPFIYLVYIYKIIVTRGATRMLAGMHFLTCLHAVHQRICLLRGDVQYFESSYSD